MVHLSNYNEFYEEAEHLLDASMYCIHAEVYIEGALIENGKLNTKLELSQIFNDISNTSVY